MNYKSFLKKNIDLSPLGFGVRESYVSYFCTPRGAKIIGTAGVDGIHFCFIRGFGEVVFAVSPMNAGNYVRPVARTFGDFLSLLVSCADTAAIEQAHIWESREKFYEFLAGCEVTPEAEAALRRLEAELSVQQIDDPFGYIKKLQAELDCSKIKYTEDFYDSDMNPSPPEKREWAVYFDASRRGRGGRELALGTGFSWYGHEWRIPSVYICGGGLVADICIAIPTEPLRDFMEKARAADAGELSSEKFSEIKRNNPMDIDFRVSFLVNGRKLRQKSGRGMPYYPAALLGDGEINVREAEEFAAHYSLDTSRAWIFHRVSFPWATSRAPREIKSLTAQLTCPPEQISGIRFASPAVGDKICFRHPLSGEEHTLTVLEYEPMENKIANNTYDFPSHNVMMRYSLAPDLPNSRFSVRDCVKNDSPRAISPIKSDDFCSIGIIGGADGPTALFLSAPQGDAGGHIALSALRFEPVREVEWQVMFREKTEVDIDVKLI